VFGLGGLTERFAQVICHAIDIPGESSRKVYHGDSTARRHETGPWHWPK
jgi:hypothetical protein